jgi:hypothetical protein
MVRVQEVLAAAFQPALADRGGDRLLVPPGTESRRSRRWVMATVRRSMNAMPIRASRAVS